MDWESVFLQAGLRRGTVYYKSVSLDTLPPRYARATNQARCLAPGARAVNTRKEDDNPLVGHQRHLNMV